ncbi:hypothetical protein OHV13_24595 [Kitasatospora purpeofusca]|uniref:hypothetical protein n=1 Tax=Kitasatospora purpeofusca TaxID=67352 RepID=UPI0032555620
MVARTYAGYVAWVERDLIPAFGHIRLLDLRPHHVDEWIAAQLEAGRGRVHAAQRAERRRLLLAAALQPGQALRPAKAPRRRWSDVHLMDRQLFVRRTLAAVNNNGLSFGRPKTEASRAWTSLSPREREFRGHAARQPIIASWACGPDPRLTRYGEASPGLLPMRTRGNT